MTDHRSTAGPSQPLIAEHDRSRGVGTTRPARDDHGVLRAPDDHPASGRPAARAIHPGQQPLAAYLLRRRLRTAPDPDAELRDAIETILEQHYAAWPDTAVTSPHEAAAHRVLEAMRANVRDEVPEIGLVELLNAYHEGESVSGRPGGLRAVAELIAARYDALFDAMIADTAAARTELEQLRLVRDERDLAQADAKRLRAELAERDRLADEPAETPEQSFAIVDANLRRMGSVGLRGTDDADG